MNRFFYLILGTSLFLVMLLTLLGLGVWQLQRLKWKEDLIERISNAQDYTPFEKIRGEEKDFVKVRLRGVFHHDLSIHLVPRTWKGKAGAHLYTPMTLIPSGQVILVNRGWTENDSVLTEPQGETDVKGLLIKPPQPGWFTPHNNPEKNVWHFIDLRALGQKYLDQGLQGALFPSIVLSSETHPHLRPLNLLSNLKNNHLSYAITWFSLAFALVVMYIIYIRKNCKR